LSEAARTSETGCPADAESGARPPARELESAIDRLQVGLSFLLALARREGVDAAELGADLHRVVEAARRGR